MRDIVKSVQGDSFATERKSRDRSIVNTPVQFGGFYLRRTQDGLRADTDWPTGCKDGDRLPTTRRFHDAAQNITDRTAPLRPTQRYVIALIVAGNPVCRDRLQQPMKIPLTIWMITCILECIDKSCNSVIRLTKMQAQTPQYFFGGILIEMLTLPWFGPILALAGKYCTDRLSCPDLSLERSRPDVIGSDPLLKPGMPQRFSLPETKIGQAIVILGEKTRLAMAHQEELTHGCPAPAGSQSTGEYTRFPSQ